MISCLAANYQRSIAASLLIIFVLSGSYTAFAGGMGKRKPFVFSYVKSAHAKAAGNPHFIKQPPKIILPDNRKSKSDKSIVKNTFGAGPTQPEMSSFKSVNTDNMVDLFTGDFNYNIPLLDVGGYPVNIFYSGNISMEQEASWVGLGWNINPGTITRNMRGIPDDFDGTEENDKLTEIQNMKPNKTFGVNFGADWEAFGYKDMFSVGGTIGISYNNYLGPSLETGLKGGVNFNIAKNNTSEKSPFNGVKLKLSLNNSSRSGLTVSPNISLVGSTALKGNVLSTGIGLSTSYNSRSGIKELQLYEQMSYNKNGEGKKDHSSVSEEILATSISFAKPSYVPSIRLPVTNSAFSGHFQLGSGIVGQYPSLEIEAYLQKSKVAPEDIIQTKPLVGYMYYQNAKENADAVMDFSRINDREVTENTPIISIPQYTYDVFSIQGEGTGGSFRAYRNDLGHVRDNLTKSKDENISLGADVGVPGHFGANFNEIHTPSVIGDWNDGNKLNLTKGFTSTDGLDEAVYFRNPGETSVLDDGQFTSIGGTDLVRFKLGGSNESPTVEPVLEHFSKKNTITGTSNITQSLSDPSLRKKRSQVISYLTAFEASEAGLDKKIRSYSSQPLLSTDNTLLYDSMLRYDGTVRQKNHISEIDVLESNGKRYVYGLPVYNTIQKDFTFSVQNDDNSSPSLVKVEDQEMDKALSPHLQENEPTSPQARDGYYQERDMPAYAHSFLLTGLLSPDYVDVTGNGITEDDLGDAVKFNYTKVGLHAWRTPLSDGNEANFNPGNHTEIKDDKGIVSYGVRESWYLHSIESKTMIAVFTLKDRRDGKGPQNEYGDRNSSDNSSKALDRIDLYNKSDLKLNGLQNAKPIKTVHFVYDGPNEELCKGTPDNTSGGGKLTLKQIYFTFNGQERNSVGSPKNQYLFAYANTSNRGTSPDNPAYSLNASDRWNSYKPSSLNPNGMKNADYPYTIQSNQSANDKTVRDQNAGAWALKKILLPSGGQIQVNYESDDYAFVQNRRAADMMKIAGFGMSPSDNLGHYNLYDATGSGIKDDNYVFINVPVACTSGNVFETYLQGLDQLAFRLAVNMPNGKEYLTAYASIAEYGVYNNNPNVIWIRLKKVGENIPEDDKIGPLAFTALEYLRQQLPGQAFTGYDVSEDEGLEKIGKIMKGWLENLEGGFSDPLNFLRSKGRAKSVDGNESSVRLNDPDGYKYGGGQRVASVTISDSWRRMTDPSNTTYAKKYTYGKKYIYTTTEMFNGSLRTISSGVASYEPSLGGEENPFQNIVQILDKLPLGPVNYGSVEMPVLDAFFPAPVVGYSKVTVQSIKKADDPAQYPQSRSGVGKQVTEFYTAKDYPVYCNYTTIDPSSDKEEHDAATTDFLYKYAYDSRAISQGFIVAINDMHGKLKSQASYAETDDNTPINYTENFYRNTGINGLDEKFDFADGSNGGVIKQGNMGIDVELMTDAREFTVQSNSEEVQAQVDLFPIFWPVWIPFIWPVIGSSENAYRAVTTTKIINYHSIVDQVLVIDKGSQVSTKNLVYDGETGKVVINQTNNEFDQPVYTTSYPAYWAYSGMGLAYKNIGATYKVSINNGKIVTPGFNQSIFESGDELYLIDKGTNPAPPSCASELGGTDAPVLWAYDKNKDQESLTSVPDFIFLDGVGNLYNRDNIVFKIIRSGKRNLLDAPLSAVTSLNSPVNTTVTPNKLKIDGSSKVVTASAIDYKEKWHIDNDLVKAYSRVYDPNSCSYSYVESCPAEINYSTSYYEKAINPYRKGLVGNFKSYHSFVYYDNRTEADQPTQPTNISKNGSFSSFSLYWDFNAANKLMPNTSSTKWVWNKQLTLSNARGMELETKNALGIYSSAQYGYTKNLPVSITQNAPYGRSFSESFEDYDFAANLTNSSPLVCEKNKYISFRGMSNSSIVNTDNLPVKAHTGNHVLQVSPSSSPATVKVLSLIPPYLSNYSMTFNSVTPTTTSLTSPGYNIKQGNGTPFYCGQTNPPGQAVIYQISGNSNGSGWFSTESSHDRDNVYVLQGTFYMSITHEGHHITGSQNLADNRTGSSYSGYSIPVTQYVTIPQSGTYTVQIGVSSDGPDIANGNIPALQGTGTDNRFVHEVVFKDVNTGEPYEPNPPGTVISAENNGTNSLPVIKANEYQYCLPQGTYSIDITCYRNLIICTSCGNADFTPPSPTTDHYWIQIRPSTSSPSLTGYASLVTTQNTACTYTAPLPAAGNMFNPTFGLIRSSSNPPAPSERMLFTAWVREDCGGSSGTPCNSPGYKNTSVTIRFPHAPIPDQQTTTYFDNATVILSPKGPVIDGWQKVEGTFTVPYNGEASAEVIFSNTGTQNAYFDDIRIQPYEAAMKSYVYDPVNLRLLAELDENNYASFYEYDDEGTLIRTKAETKDGIKTIKETRSALQKDITTIQY